MSKAFKLPNLLKATQPLDVPPSHKGKGKCEVHPITDSGAHRVLCLVGNRGSFPLERGVQDTGCVWLASV